MKTKKIVHKSRSLKKTIKKKQNAGGLREFIRKLKYRTTPTTPTTPTTFPIETKNFDFNKYELKKDHLMELLQHKMAIEKAIVLLENEKTELDKLKGENQKNFTERDGILLDNINKDITRLKDEITKIDKKIKEFTEEFTKMARHNNLNTLLKDKYANETPEKIKARKEEFNAVEKYVYRGIDLLPMNNNKSKVTYKKYSQFREGLFNNIERNKKERKEREEIKTQRNKKELENIYQQIYQKLVENRQKYLEFLNKEKNNLNFILRIKKELRDRGDKIDDKITQKFKEDKLEKEKINESYHKEDGIYAIINKEYAQLKSDLEKQIPNDEIKAKVAPLQAQLTKLESEMEDIIKNIEYIKVIPINDDELPNYFEREFNNSRFRKLSKYFTSPVNNIKRTEIEQEKILEKVNKIYREMIYNRIRLLKNKHEVLKLKLEYEREPNIFPLMVVMNYYNNELIPFWDNEYKSMKEKTEEKIKKLKADFLKINPDEGIFNNYMDKFKKFLSELLIILEVEEINIKKVENISELLNIYKKIYKYSEITKLISKIIREINISNKETDNLLRELISYNNKKKQEYSKGADKIATKESELISLNKSLEQYKQNINQDMLRDIQYKEKLIDLQKLFSELEMETKTIFLSRK